MKYTLTIGGLIVALLLWSCSEERSAKAYNLISYEINKHGDRQGLGTLIGIETYRNGKLAIKHVFDSTEKGKRIKTFHYTTDELDSAYDSEIEGYMKNHSIIYRDKYRNVMEVATHSEGELPQNIRLVHKHTLNSANLPVVTTVVDTSGHIWETITNSYDNQNRLIYKKIESGQIKPSTETFITYYDKNKKLEEIIRRDSLGSKSQYRYDSKGRLIEERLYNNGTPLSEVKYEYSDNHLSKVIRNYFNYKKFEIVYELSD